MRRGAELRRFGCENLIKVQLVRKRGASFRPGSAIDRNIVALTQDDAVGLRRRLPDEPDGGGSDFWEEDPDWRARYCSRHGTSSQKERSFRIDLTRSCFSGIKWRTSLQPVHLHLTYQLLTLIEVGLKIFSYFIQKKWLNLQKKEEIALRGKGKRGKKKCF